MATQNPGSASPSPVPVAPATPPEPQNSPSAPVTTEVPPSASEAPASQGPPVAPKPPTLNDVIAQRQAERQGRTTPLPQMTPATPSVDENTPQNQGDATPHATPAEPPKKPDQQALLEQAQRDQFWEYAKQDPQKAVELLQKLQPEPGETKEAPKLFKTAEYLPQWQQQANEAYTKRGRLTLSGLLGGQEVLESLELQDSDMTDAMTQFIQASIAPQLLALLGEHIAPLREQLETVNHSVQPVLSTRLEESIAKDGGSGIREAFPSIVNNKAATEHFNKTFEDFASALYPKELLENPQSNPQEYVRMLKGIATLAARSWVEPSPAPTEPAAQPQPIAQPQAMSPAPQRIVPEHRNHLGQFSPQQPVTLEAANALRAQKLQERYAHAEG